MASLLGASWKTTLIGFVAAVINYIAGLGMNLPTDGKGWGTVMLSAALFAFGAATKDANVSNAPNPSQAAPVK